MSSGAKSKGVRKSSSQTVVRKTSVPTGPKSFFSRSLSADPSTRVDDMEELRVAFSMLDRNKDGVLSVQELQDMLKNFNIEVPDELVLELFHNCSHTGSGLLTETEFLEFVSTHLIDDTPVDTSEELLAAFRVFDKDNNGFITRDELKTAMELMGETLTDQDVDNMIALADLNKDGKIDYEEFSNLMT